MAAAQTFHGVPIEAVHPGDAVAALIERVTQGGYPTSYRFVNAYTMSAAAHDVAYQAVLRGPGVNLPDGRPLAAVMSRTATGDACFEQVRGPWFFEACLDRGRSAGVRHYLLGTTPETLATLEREIESRYPGALVVGRAAPPFRTLSLVEQKEQDESIIEATPDVVWVSLGTPKQDIEAARIVAATGITTAAVGAAFDFAAGTKSSAPDIFIDSGTEWLYRLATEPRRLWRRYLFGNSRFLLLSAQHLRTERQRQHADRRSDQESDQQSDQRS